LFGIDTWVVHRDWNSVFSQGDPQPAVALRYLAAVSRVSLKAGAVAGNQVVEGEVVSVERIPPSGNIPVSSVGGFTIGVGTVFSPATRLFGWVEGPGGIYWSGSTLSRPSRSISLALVRDRNAVYFYVDGIPQPIQGNGKFLSDCRNLTINGLGCASGRVVQWVGAVLRDHGAALIDDPQSDARVGPLGGCAAESTSLFVCDRSVSSEVMVALANPSLVVFTQPALPLVYAARSVSHVANWSYQTLMAAAETTSKQPDPAIVRLGREIPRPGGSVTWQEIDSARFDGILRLGKSGIGLVVFGNTYDPGWKLALSHGSVIRHIVVNGYANGWLVKGRGVSRFTIVYGPDREFVDGEIVGLCVGLGGLLLVGREWLRRLSRWIRLYQ
jgi:hypothetical protein